MNNTTIKKVKVDYLLIIGVFLLCLIGAVFVYSASNYVAEIDYSDKFFYLKKQLIGYFLGAVAFIATSLVSYEKLKKYSLLIVIASIIMLILVLTPLGKEAYGAKRWIAIGSFTIQPSELAKLALVIFSASYFSADCSRTKTFKGILPVLAVGGLICLLIIIEPNMSITVCVGLIMIAMLFLSGTNLKSLILIIIPVLIALPVMIIAEPYRMKRLMAFLDPWASPKGEGYQLIQSLYALGAGGLFGTGLFKSRQKMRFLPFAESDFILSVIGEECGFFGILILFAVCLLIVWRLVVIARNAKDYFGYLLVIGICLTFIIQIAVNALVVTGSIPPTGLPFPLVSSGNTQIIVFMASFGIANNVSNHSVIKLTKDSALA